MSLGDAIARLAPELPAFEPGHVWLAGAGPGALGCLTVEVVAALADARIPATRRGVSKALILATGHAVGTPGDLDWAALARTGQPIVIYMGLAAVGEIAAALMAGGLPPATPAAVIASATTPEERVLVADLGSIAARVAAEGIRAPALVVVGEIVALRAELIALARAEAQA